MQLLPEMLKIHCKLYIISLHGWLYLSGINFMVVLTILYQNFKVPTNTKAEEHCCKMLLGSWLLLNFAATD